MLGVCADLTRSIERGLGLAYMTLRISSIGYIVYDIACMPAKLQLIETDALVA